MQGVCMVLLSINSSNSSRSSRLTKWVAAAIALATFVAFSLFFLVASPVRLYGGEWGCRSITNYFTDPVDTSVLSSLENRWTIRDLDVDEMATVLGAVAKRLPDSEVVVCRASREMRQDAKDHYAAPLVWSLMWLEGTAATPELIGLIRQRGRSGTYAIAAMERLWFRKTQSPVGQFEAAAEEWEHYSSSDQMSDWDAILQRTLVEYGVSLQRHADGSFTVDSLLEAWDTMPLRGFRASDFTTDADAIAAVPVRTLISMRLSELLCERTGVYTETPAAFPRGFPDLQWSASQYYGRGFGAGGWRHAVNSRDRIDSFMHWDGVHQSTASRPGCRPNLTGGRVSTFAAPEGTFTYGYPTCPDELPPCLPRSRLHKYDTVHDR